MALFFECMEQCAQKVLDAADIVRDGDFSLTALYGCEAEHRHRYRQRMERRFVVAGRATGKEVGLGSSLMTFGNSDGTVGTAIGTTFGEPLPKSPCL